MNKNPSTYQNGVLVTFITLEKITKIITSNRQIILHNQLVSQKEKQIQFGTKHVSFHEALNQKALLGKPNGQILIAQKQCNCDMSGQR